MKHWYNLEEGILRIENNVFIKYKVWIWCFSELENTEKLYL